MPSVVKRIIQILTLIAFGITGSLFSQNYLVSAELYPTVISSNLLIYTYVFEVIRNLANAHSSTWSRFGAVVGPALFNLVSVRRPITDVYIHFQTYPLPYFALLLISLLDVIAFQCFIPETKSKPLPDNMPSQEESIYCFRRRRRLANNEDVTYASVEQSASL